MSENSCGATLSDADAKARYGPNWRGVRALIAQVYALTPEQIARARLVDRRRWEFAGAVAANAAWNTGNSAWLYAAENDACEAAWAAACTPGVPAGSASCVAQIAYGAAGVVAVRHLVVSNWSIRPRGIPKRHLIDKQYYDTLMQPWRVMIDNNTTGGQR